MPRGEKGKHFSKEYQPRKRTGPRNTATMFLAAVKVDLPEMTINKTDYYRILQLILSGNKEYITNLAQREDLPVSLLCIIKAIKTDIEEGTTKTVDSLLDRIFGKRTEITGADGKPLIPQAEKTLEEIEAEIKRLQEK